MHDFLDKFPPEIDHPIIERAAVALAKWARHQEVMRNLIRFEPRGFEVLYCCDVKEFEYATLGVL